MLCGWLYPERGQKREISPSEGHFICPEAHDAAFPLQPGRPGGRVGQRCPLFLKVLSVSLETMKIVKAWTRLTLWLMSLLGDLGTSLYLSEPVFSQVSSS